MPILWFAQQNNNSDTYFPSGGVRVAGTARANYISNPNIVPAGVLAAGLAIVINEILIIPAGLLANGSALAPTIYNINLTSAGVRLGGVASVAHDMTVPTTGSGLLAGGLGAISYDYVTFGGVLVAGVGAISYGGVTFGGVFVAGVGVNTIIINEPPNGLATGGLLASGNSIYNTSHIFVFESDGLQVIMGGAAKAGIKNARYVASGGFVLDDSQNIINFKFVKNFKFLYNVRTMIESDITFLYNVGQLQIFWYRVVSKGIDGNQPCPLQGNPCCQKYIVTLKRTNASGTMSETQQAIIQVPNRERPEVQQISREFTSERGCSRRQG